VAYVLAHSRSALAAPVLGKVQEKRACADPNPAFRNQLQAAATWFAPFFFTLGLWMADVV